MPFYKFHETGKVRIFPLEINILIAISGVLFVTITSITAENDTSCLLKEDLRRGVRIEVPSPHATDNNIVLVAFFATTFDFHNANFCNHAKQ